MNVTESRFKNRQLHIEDYLQMVSAEQKEYANDERQIMTSKEVVSLALFSCRKGTDMSDKCYTPVIAGLRCILHRTIF